VRILLILLLITFIGTKLVYGQSDVQDQKPNVAKNTRPGFLNTTELNLGFGLGITTTDYAKGFAGLTSILGYGIKKNLQVGIGAGLLFYNGGNLVPLFLDLRFIKTFRKISVYVFLEGGILFNSSESAFGNRYLLNPGTGIKYPIGSKLSANLGAGLLVQTTSDNIHDSFINLKLGLTYSFRK
jgi:hypothetical protein